MQTSSIVVFVLSSIVCIGFVWSQLPHILSLLSPSVVPPIVPLDPMFPVNCTSHIPSLDINLSVEICEIQNKVPSISFYLDNSVLLTYSGNDTMSLIDHLRRCILSSPRMACPMYEIAECPNYSPLLWIALCFDDRYNLSYAFVDRVQISRNEAYSIANFVITHPLISVL